MLIFTTVTLLLIATITPTYYGNQHKHHHDRGCDRKYYDEHDQRDVIPDLKLKEYLDSLRNDSER